MNDLNELMKIFVSMKNTQEYFMMVAEKSEEVTLTFKNEPPYVTIFLGKGPEAPIGVGNSVAEAILDVMEQRRLSHIPQESRCSCGKAH